MASQLRLRVVLPVAVLGLLGLGVGTFATRAPDPSGALPPLPPAQSGTTTRKAHESAWAKRANSLCARVLHETETDFAAEPSTAAEVDAALANLLEAYESAEPRFSALGWPSGEKKAVLQLRATLKTYVATLREALTAFRTGNADALRRSLERGDQLAQAWNRRIKRLGADVCAEDPLGALSERAIAKYGSAEAALNHQLVQHGVVVVLFYAPGDDYDTIQTRETRAGALAARAGFLALDVTRNKQVGTLAAKYDVRDAPTTLIFKRGPRLAYRIAGYMDRQAVAQAAANARS